MNMMEEDSNQVVDLRDCEFSYGVNGVLSHGKIEFIHGSLGELNAIYGRCYNGNVTCFEEDAIQDRADDIVPCDKAVNPEERRKLQTISVRTWPNSVLCFHPLSSGLFDDNEVALIQGAFDDIQSKTNEITLMNINDCVPGTGDCGDCQHAVEFIRDGTGCYSLLGYQERANQPLSLGQGCFGDGLYVPVHELGHALGLAHEQAHEDRNLLILRDAVPQGLESQFAKVGGNGFVKTSFDVESVMMYPVDSRMCIVVGGDASDYCDIIEDASDGCKVPDRTVDCDVSQEAQELAQLYGPSGNVIGLSDGDVKALDNVYGGDGIPGGGSGAGGYTLILLVAAAIGIVIIGSKRNNSR